MAEKPTRDPRLEAIYGQAVHDPRGYLRELLGIMERGVRAGWHLDPAKKRLLLLRRGPHKAVRELRDGCIFACLIEQVLGVKMKVVAVRDQNHDADVFTLWDDKFCPVQLKELPPGYISAQASLDALLKGLKKYHSPDTVVAIYLNRRLKGLEFTVPAGLDLAGIWLFGARTEDSSRWVLIGDLLRDHALHDLSLGL